jgi:hypothetical protein
MAYLVEINSREGMQEIKCRNLTTDGIVVATHTFSSGTPAATRAGCIFVVLGTLQAQPADRIERVPPRILPRDDIGNAALGALPHRRTDDSYSGSPTGHCGLDVSQAKSHGPDRTAVNFTARSLGLIWLAESIAG